MFTGKTLKIGAVGIVAGVLWGYSQVSATNESTGDYAFSPEPEPRPNHAVTLTPGAQTQLDEMAKNILRHTTEYLDMKVPENYVDGRDFYMGTVPQAWFMNDRRHQDTLSWSVLLGHANTDGTKLKLKAETGWKTETGQVMSRAVGRIVLVNETMEINKLSAEAIVAFLDDPDTHFLRVLNDQVRFRSSSRVDGSELTGHDTITDGLTIERHIEDPVYSALSQMDSFAHDYRLPPKYS